MIKMDDQDPIIGLLIELGLTTTEAKKVREEGFHQDLVDQDVALDAIKNMNSQFQRGFYFSIPDGTRLRTFDAYLTSALNGGVKGLTKEDATKCLRYDPDIGGVNDLALVSTQIVTAYDVL